MPSRSRTTQRERYAFDDRNRLLVADPRDALAPQQILDGRVTLEGRNRLVYQVGISLSSGRTQRRRVTLFGTWKLRRDLSVAFEVPYADDCVEAIQFEGTYAPSPRDRVAVALRARPDNGGANGHAVGLTVTFTKDVTPDLSFFLRLRKDKDDTSAIGGVQVRF